MKICIIGATSKVGKTILSEAIMRHHDVTVIVRNKNKMNIPNINFIEKGVFDLTRQDLIQFDVVINAFGSHPVEEQLHLKFGRFLISLLENSNTRLFVVGGIGNIFIDDHNHVIDFNDNPEEHKLLSSQQIQNLARLQNSSIRWTFLIPSILFDSDGPRTGHYILGKDYLLYNSQFISYVSYSDFAVAVLDEIEHPKHENTYFTVDSENPTICS